MDTRPRTSAHVFVSATEGGAFSFAFEADSGPDVPYTQHFRASFFGGKSDKMEDIPTGAERKSAKMDRDAEQAQRDREREKREKNRARREQERRQGEAAQAQREQEQEQQRKEQRRRERRERERHQQQEQERRERERQEREQRERQEQERRKRKERENRERKEKEKHERKEKEKRERQQQERREQENRARREAEKQKRAQMLRDAWVRYTAPQTSGSVSFSSLAWPVVAHPTCPDDLTLSAVREFVLADTTFPGLVPRACVKAALRRWHPDKFWPAFEGSVRKADRARLAEGVLIVVGHLNELLKEVQ
jgi:hypothetical protein